jgi:hypothetical protein
MKRRKPYSEEIRQEAVKLVTEQGLAATQVARDRDISSDALHRWLRAAPDMYTTFAAVICPTIDRLSASSRVASIATPTLAPRAAKCVRPIAAQRWKTAGPSGAEALGEGRLLGLARAIWSSCFSASKPGRSNPTGPPHAATSAGTLAASAKRSQNTPPAKNRP